MTEPCMAQGQYANLLKVWGKNCSFELLPTAFSPLHPSDQAIAIHRTVPLEAMLYDLQGFERGRGHPVIRGANQINPSCSAPRVAGFLEMGKDAARCGLGAESSPRTRPSTFAQAAAVAKRIGECKAGQY